MAILVGSEEAGATAVALSKERAYATKRTAATTGKVKKLSIKVTAANKATGFRLAILANSGGKPGAMLGETGTITVATETALTVTGELASAVEVEEGKEYFLAVVTVTGTTAKVLCTSKAAWGWKNSVAVTKIEGASITAEFAEFGEPAPIWGESVSGGTHFDRSTEDAVEVSESTSRTALHPRTAEDATEVVESTNATKGWSRFTSDTVELAEATTRVAHFPRSSSEVGVIEEKPTTTIGFSRSASDTLSVAESAIAKPGFSRPGSDPVSVGEAVHVASSHHVATADGLSVGEEATTHEEHPSRVSVSVFASIVVGARIPSTVEVDHV